MILSTMAVGSMLEGCAPFAGTNADSLTLILKSTVSEGPVTTVEFNVSLAGVYIRTVKAVQDAEAPILWSQS